MNTQKFTALFLSLAVITISAISCVPTPADTSQTQPTITSNQSPGWITLTPVTVSTTTITSFPSTAQTTISTQSMSSAKPKTTTTTLPIIRTTTTTPHTTITTTTTTSPTTTTTPTETTTVTTSTPAPAQLSLQIVSVTSPVKAGSSATLVAQTKPNAECAITVYLKSGPSRAAGLTKKNADSDGKASWTWKVGSSATPGDYKIVVTASLNGETVSQTTYFTIQ